MIVEFDLQYYQGGRECRLHSKLLYVPLLQSVFPVLSGLLSMVPSSI